MKKTLLIALISSGVSLSFAQQQIGNSDFEAWGTAYSGEPINWNSFESADGDWNSFSGDQVDESTDVRPGSAGSSSARIKARNPFGSIIANGNLTVGRVRMGSTSPASSLNYNYSVTGNTEFSEAFTGMPDSVVFWVKATIGGAEEARMKATLHDNYNYRDPEDANASTHVVASAIINFPATTGWVRKSVPFVYSGPASSVEYILITFTTNKNPGGGAASDLVFLDDVELIYVPKATFTASSVSICPSSSVDFTNTSSNFPTSYSWNFGDGSPASTATSPSHTYAAQGNYNVTLTATNQWGSTTSQVLVVTVNAAANSSFTYPTNTICLSDGNQTPTTTEAGTFSSSPAGLSFVSTSTGEINVSSTNAGIYTINYAVNGACPTSTNVTVFLTSNPDATFSYVQSAYCGNEVDPSPSFGTGASGGVFSALPAGMSINSNSGIIDLSSSTAGTYTVTNEIAAVGACPASTETYAVTVNALPTVALGTFSDVCDYNSSFSLTGGSPAGGTYSGTGVSAGSFDPATAGLGSQTITYTYSDGTCSNSASSTIDVDACLGLDDNLFNLVSVYPNPTDGKLNVSNISNETSFKVISISGQVVLSGVVSSSVNSIDLSTLENGVYVLQLAQEQTVNSIQVVKK